MITVETLQSEVANTEMISMLCEEQEGITNCFSIHIERAELDTDKQVTYDNFVGLLGATWDNEILNTTPMMSINRVTSEAVVEGMTSQDYVIDFDATQKGYVDSFLQLVMDLYE
jgi:hypothetical protein